MATQQCRKLKRYDGVQPRDPSAARSLHDRLSLALANCSPHFEAKRRVLVESPAAVEDALASLLDNQESRLQVCLDAAYFV